MKIFRWPGIVGFSLVAFFASCPPAVASDTPTKGNLPAKQAVSGGFPARPPVRERCLVLDQQSSWTLRKGDRAAPLVVVPMDDRVVVSLTGGWIVLGPELDFRAESLMWIPSAELDRTAPEMEIGTPVATVSGQGVVFLEGSRLGVFYPELGTVFRHPAADQEADTLTVTQRGISATQGRRLFVMKNWNKVWAEAEPLPFFPSDFTSSISGRPWACDSLQARAWVLDGEFWNRLDPAQTPGRMTGISPFPDENGYFACGPGWVGAFSVDGTRLWTLTKTLGGAALPPDLKIRSAAGRLYLWSALERKVWVWSWTAEGPSGDVEPVDISAALDAARDEAKRLALRGGFPEAALTMSGAEALARSRLALEPFSTVWSRLADDASSLNAEYRRQGVGDGTLAIVWSHPNGAPLADWTWTPDAGTTASASLRVASTTFWEGRTYETLDFTIASDAQKTPWPGVRSELYGPLELPSWMNVEVFPPSASKKSTDAEKETEIGWGRFLLPIPPQPYDLPTE